MRFHGRSKEVFKSAPHIRKRTILTWLELGPIRNSFRDPFFQGSQVGVE